MAGVSALPSCRGEGGSLEANLARLIRSLWDSAEVSVPSTESLKEARRRDRVGRTCDKPRVVAATMWVGLKLGRPGQV